MLEAKGKLSSIPLILSSEAIMLIALFVFPFYVLPLIAYSFQWLMPIVFGIGFFIIIPFSRINKTAQGALFGVTLTASALFVSFTGVVFTYNQDLRTTLLIAIPVILSILIAYYTYKNTKEWNKKF